MDWGTGKYDQTAALWLMACLLILGPLVVPVSGLIKKLRGRTKALVAAVLGIVLFTGIIFVVSLDRGPSQAIRRAYQAHTYPRRFSDRWIAQVQSDLAPLGQLALSNVQERDSIIPQNQSAVFVAADQPDVLWIHELAEMNVLADRPESCRLVFYFADVVTTEERSQINRVVTAVVTWHSRACFVTTLHGRAIIACKVFGTGSYPDNKLAALRHLNDELVAWAVGLVERPLTEN